MVEEGVTSIGSYAFTETALRRIIVPDSVTSLGDVAFAHCFWLSELQFSSGLTEIPGMVCYGDSLLTSVTVPEHVTTIHSNAFFYADGLKSVSLPASLTYVADSAFAYCSSLEDVYFAGTKAQTFTIAIESNNTHLGSARWHCSDGVMQGIGAKDGICGSSMQSFCRKLC